MYRPEGKVGEGSTADAAPLLVFKRLADGELEEKFKELRVDVDRDELVKAAEDAGK